jgi:hypothetical protein
MTLESLSLVIAVATPLMIGLVWLIKAVSGVQREFKPNGGSSARDLWQATQADVRDMRARLDDHIDNHAKGTR